MSEYKKFYEVVKKMNPGDVFKTELEEFKLKDHGGFTCNGDDLTLTQGMMYFEGKIIPAEPVVLSAEEILDKSAMSNSSGTWDLDCVKAAIDLAQKNGQIKERINLQPLIDAAYAVRDYYYSHLKDSSIKYKGEFEALDSSLTETGND